MHRIVLDRTEQGSGFHILLAVHPDPRHIDTRTDLLREGRLTRTLRAVSKEHTDQITSLIGEQLRTARKRSVRVEHVMVIHLRDELTQMLRPILRLEHPNGDVESRRLERDHRHDRREPVLVLKGTGTSSLGLGLLHPSKLRRLLKMTHQVLVKRRTESRTHLQISLVRALPITSTSAGSSSLMFLITLCFG